MPAVLTDQQTCATQVPFVWRDLIIDLEKFLEAARQLRRAEVDASPTQTPPFLLTLHARLLSRSAMLLEPDVLADQSAREDDRLLTKATLLLTRLGECVAASQRQRLDTAGSRILSRFAADFETSEQNLRRLHAALATVSKLGPDEFIALDAEIERDIMDAARKRNVVTAIREHYGLWNDEAELRANIWRLFSDFYPDTGLVANEVELIVTGCLIFFCIPYKDSELLTDRFRQVSDSERAKIERFLVRVERFAHWQFAHFPVFGFLQGRHLPDATLRTIAKKAGLSVQQAADEISQLTAIVPLGQVDKYVPHDVWGHSWQASMLHFDDLYKQLATFADPPLLQTRVQYADGSSLYLADCFPIEDRVARCLPSKFETFAKRLVEQRLSVALAPVFAELLADIAEYNLLEVEPQRTDELPNSSLLQSFPSKLDLMLEDVFFYFGQATKTFRLWSRQVERRGQTIAALRQLGATRVSAEAAVAEARDVWNTMESDLFASTIRWRVDQQQLHVNVVTRVALNFLGVHRAILETYRRVSDQNVGDLPLRSFRDLLLLATGVFFETDPPRNLWRVDEFVSLRIVPWCEALASATKARPIEPS